MNTCLVSIRTLLTACSRDAQRYKSGTIRVAFPWNAEKCFVCSQRCRAEEHRFRHNSSTDAASSTLRPRATSSLSPQSGSELRSKPQRQRRRTSPGSAATAAPAIARNRPRDTVPLSPARGAAQPPNSRERPACASAPTHAVFAARCLFPPTRPRIRPYQRIEASSVPVSVSTAAATLPRDACTAVAISGAFQGKKAA